MEAIDDGGFDITALNMFIVENINAAEFYEVYKGIVPEYKVLNLSKLGTLLFVELICNVIHTIL